ncbi:beta-ketoacyl-[acyl-carrier-protein] synthase family protein [Komagataeibacter xylinus]|uniref:beta-ketoacyl-[acyl-carrier-protein] synthase family protein n=1 Tax=Komagataeibacter xylinus TaxID=28448 RepID=UPI001F5E6449|nr:beta-ketoacyl-[acyl-carrier-protein] synthase family protein [Komagataeibacter xylinus]
MSATMTALRMTAGTGISAIGRGVGQTLAALRNRRTGLEPCDFAGITHGYAGPVAGVQAHAVPPALAAYDCRNNRLIDMALRTDGVAEAIMAARAHYGAGRIGVVMGTSTSGVLASEDAFCAMDAQGRLPANFDYEHTQDLFSLARYVRAALELGGPALCVSMACASSSRAFMDAAYLIRAGICDAVVVGGADSLCRMTLRGFAALELVSARRCRPCDALRDGISIGEAAGIVLLERPDGRAISGPSAGFRATLLGYGASSDGHHMSTPHPQGAGAALAMQRALDSARLPVDAIDYINLHGTGTRANDAMEDRAVSTRFGTHVPCSSTKGWTGHTLGACGVLEAMICALAIEHGFMPGCLGVDEVDPTFRANVLTTNMARPVRHVMSNAFGFGGANCSLIFGKAA